MASPGGTLDARNVVDIGVQKEQSKLAFIQDDDQVADWVSAHTTADIANLSTADKLRALQTLQGGFISAQDLAAIGRICRSVSSHSEAEAIRDGVDLSQFVDLGQRTQMRVFLAQMP